MCSQRLVVRMLWHSKASKYRRFLCLRCEWRMAPFSSPKHRRGVSALRPQAPSFLTQLAAARKLVLPQSFMGKGKRDASTRLCGCYHIRKHRAGPPRAIVEGPVVRKRHRRSFTTDIALISCKSRKKAVVTTPMLSLGLESVTSSRKTSRHSKPSSRRSTKEDLQKKILHPRSSAS